VNLDSDTFEKFLHALHYTCVILKKQRVRSGFSVHTEVAFFALMAPLRVRKIAKSEVTGVLPLYSYVVVNRASCLTESLSARSKEFAGRGKPHEMYIGDNEGQFYFAPAKMVAYQLATDMIKVCQKMVSARTALVTRRH
jgi:hypothetical protein